MTATPGHGDKELIEAKMTIGSIVPYDRADMMWAPMLIPTLAHTPEDRFKAWGMGSQWNPERLHRLPVKWRPPELVEPQWECPQTAGPLNCTLLTTILLMSTGPGSTQVRSSFKLGWRFNGWDPTQPNGLKKLYLAGSWKRRALVGLSKTMRVCHGFWFFFVFFLLFYTRGDGLPFVDFCFLPWLVKIIHFF